MNDNTSFPNMNNNGNGMSNVLSAQNNNALLSNNNNALNSNNNFYNNNNVDVYDIEPR